MKKLFAYALVSFVAVSVLGIFCAISNSNYQEASTYAFSQDTQVIIIENYGQEVEIDNTEYYVFSAEPIRYNDENYYDLALVSGVVGEAPGSIAPDRYLWAPADVYETALNNEGPVIFYGTIIPEAAAPPAAYGGSNILPVVAVIGAIIGVVAIAIWSGYRQNWGKATSTLIELGLQDMTVRDVEIIGYMMEKKEFTIPELMKLSNASKITTWRTVQKLVDKGLVETTEDTKVAANGLGGRGKPSNIYRYVGQKEESKTDE